MKRRKSDMICRKLIFPFFKPARCCFARYTQDPEFESVKVYGSLGTHPLNVRLKYIKTPKVMTCKPVFASIVKET